MTELEQKLAKSKKQLLREEVTSFEKRTAIAEKREQLEYEELQSLQLFQVESKESYQLCFHLYRSLTFEIPLDKLENS